MIDDRDRVYLRHILDACERIKTYTAGIDLDEFMSRSMVQDAVVRQLEIIGEASKQIGEQVKGDVPDVEWVDIAGMRDRLIHHYFGVDLAIVWETVRRDVPHLHVSVQAILAN